MARSDSACVRSDRPLTGLTTFRPDPVVVGRDAELATLGRLLREVAAGRGHAVWIEGEPGIGKTTLLATGLADAERLGCQSYLLAADELAQRFPLRVVLDGLGITPHSPDLDRRAIGELARGELAGSGTAVDPVPAITEQLLEMLDRWCGRAPVVLAMDDLQYADEASLVVWHRLGRVVRQLPLLLVATARPTSRRAELGQLRRGLLAAGATLMPLEPLSTADVVRLTGTVTGAATVGPALRQTLEQAAGNPLYVHEMIDALDRDGRITRDRDAADLPDESAPVPRSLAAAISNRLGFVTEHTMGVLRSAALLGTAFSVTDLATVSGRTVLDLAPAIDEAVAVGLLVESGSRLAFRHGLIRAALHEQTPSGLRLALHGHAARALHEAGAAADDVARQLLAALPPDEPMAAPEWVVDWLLRAGRALAYRSPQVAADLLDHAVRHLPDDDARRESLQVLLATVLVLLGRRDEVVPLAERVLAGTGRAEHAAEMSLNLAWSHAAGARSERALEVVQRALQAPDLDLDWVARLRVMHARILQMTPGNAQGSEVAERALAEARRAGNRLAAGTAMHVMAMAHYFRGDPAGALEVYDQALAEIDDDAQSIDLRLILLHNRSIMLFDIGRPEETEAAIQELLRVAERGASPPRLATMRLGAAAHYYFTGRWDDALAEIEATLDEGDRMATEYQQCQHGMTALIAVHRDNPVSTDDARTMDRLLAGAAVAGAEYPLLARAGLAERDGDPERALALLRAWFGSVSYLATRDLWLPELVRLALATGDRDLAADAARTSEGDLTGASTARAQRAAAQRCRGLVDEDATLLLAAADTYREIGRTVELAQTLEDAAVVLAGQGDRAAARAAYAEAADRYAAVGAAWDLRRADSRLRPLGLRRQRAPRRRATTGWEALTPTELDVARLVAEGLPNPDIAARLFSSRRTIEVHVSHILTKLAVRSRVEVAREAALHLG